MDKSSDCVDFIKSMDLSDWSENIQIFPNSFNFFYKFGDNYNYNSKSSVLDFSKSTFETYATYSLGLYCPDKYLH